MSNYIADDILMHYGVSIVDGAPGRGSGRYPRGSGENPYQNHTAGDFLSRVHEMRKQNLKYTDPKTGQVYTGDTAIAKIMGLSSSQFRVQYTMAKNEERSAKVAAAKRLQLQGMGPNEIGRQMGVNESTVRSWLDEHSEERMKKAEVTAQYLKDAVDSKGMIDVGAGVERELGVSREKLNEALYSLELQGYKVYGGGVPQVTHKGQQTNIKVLCPPGTAHKEIYNFENVHSFKDYDGDILTENGEKRRPRFQYPESMDSSRLQIRYAEEGGLAKDGVIELRRGVQDLSLGESHYAQVRILVDGTHYIKGMAVYSDDMPPGIDAVFNTNKKKGTPVCGPKDNTVLKPIEKDPDNPFGSLIKEKGGQSYYDDPNGKFTDPVTGEKQSLSLINKRSDEADWQDWSDGLPAQFLSKQPRSLITKQLNLSIADRAQEFEEIKNLTQPTVKKKLLEDFADECDSAAVHLKAASLPRQKYEVILPLKTVGDTQVYAPNFRDGEKVALIRYPHGGTFEIPILTVNNKNEEGRRVIGSDSKDAVGISAKVAERLSGADFDGDTVMVIPTGGSIKITSTPRLKDLEGFDPKWDYGPESSGGVPYKRLSKDGTQIEMGKISNLITDMTLKGADEGEIARAVKHSMVVIDAHKHNLDYRRSEKENGIPALKRTYQGRIDERTGKYTESASTLISRANAQQSVEKRQGAPRIEDDGSLSWKLADDLTYVDKKGRTVTRMQESKQMLETKDAMTLSSGTVVENLYAHYANQCKAMANSARKEMKATKDIAYNPSAARVYEEEVKSIRSKVNLASLNQPRERIANAMAVAEIRAKKQANPDMDKKEEKKLSQLALTKARERVGAHREPVSFTDREWEAVNAGAVSKTLLSQAMRYANMDDLRARATPRSHTILSPAKINKMKAMRLSGYTTAEIADELGVSTSTITRAFKEYG